MNLKLFLLLCPGLYFSRVRQSVTLTPYMKALNENKTVTHISGLPNYVRTNDHLVFPQTAVVFLFLLPLFR